MADLTTTTNATKIISLQNLNEYDALIKQYISDADAVVDAKSIKTVLIDGDNIKFYKKANATIADTADYTVAISSSDVEQLKTNVAALQSVTKGYDAEGSIKTAIETAQADATQAITNAATADGKAVKAQEDVDALKVKVGDIPEGTATTVTGYVDVAVKKLADGQVKTNKEAIDAINNTTTGILATAKGYTDGEVKKVTDSIGIVPTDSTVMAEISNAKKAGIDAQSTIDAYKTANDTRVQNVEDRATALEDAVGNTEDLETTSQVVVGAINELKGVIENAESAGKVTVDTSATTEGYLKTYTIKQGGTTIATVDIPKDMVVQSGEIVVDPAGQPSGTYIKLVIANQEAPIFINVKDLVDIYTAKAEASQIQLAISDTNEISATIVAGAVGTTELANDAVVTAKIADKNVTLVKLSDSVQASLGLADTALQSADITTGSANGTIAVEGADVAVKGLEDAAFTTVATLNATAQGYANDAEANAKAYADGLYEISSTADINKLFEVNSAE